MNARIVLRLASLGMLVVAAIFVCCMMACPTCGRVFYIGGFRFGVEEWWAFYRAYVFVMAALFVASFFVKKGGKRN